LVLLAYYRHLLLFATAAGVLSVACIPSNFVILAVAGFSAFAGTVAGVPSVADFL
jgi:hypothetical protein